MQPELVRQMSILRQQSEARKVGSEYPAGTEIPQFSSYTLRRLEFEGNDHFYILTGRPINALAQSHLNKQKIWSLGNENDPRYNKSAESFQVAINTRKLIIPNSSDKNAIEQEKLTLKYSEKVNILGVKAIMLEASQIFDLVLQHWQKTGEHLLGEEDGYKFVRGRTYAGDNTSTSIGCFSNALGLRVREDHINYKSPQIGALRVLVPDIVASTLR